MGNGHMGTPCEQTDRQTDMIENITFQQFRWRVVKMEIHNAMVNMGRSDPVFAVDKKTL